VTCIRGHEAPLGDDLIPQLAPDGVEVECSEGGQPRYWWLISAE
jgi:hypothetical protein